MEQAVHHAANAVTAEVKPLNRAFRWGTQLDVRRITLDGDLTEQAVAGYIAKYATKAAERVGTLDRRIQPLDDLNALPVRDHARRLIAACLRLGEHPGLADLRLTHWAHMLGFRGHFSTKSRHYSTTLGALRAARDQHMRTDEITTRRLPLFEEDTVLVISHWPVGACPWENNCLRRQPRTPRLAERPHGLVRLATGGEVKTTYDVKIGQVQQRTDRSTNAYIARWRVAGKQKSKSFRTKGLANAFLSDLRQAAKAGEKFDISTGLPVSMLSPAQAGPSFLEFAQAYVLRRWNSSAARTRETDA
ncbi:MAG TPA: replication initiator [Nonomuraea sp.]|nr:replication initiator [Nonomuraea sp.]